MMTQNPEDAAVPASGFDEHIGFIGDAVLYEEQVQPQHGVLGLTVRELSIIAVWLIAFVVSFFPVMPGSASLWSSNIDWLLPIGVPTAAVFLLVLRRFSPDGIRRVGSLGIDQFASVAFSVAAVWWIQQHWALIAQAIDLGALPFSWVNWVQLVAMLALVVLSVCAPFVPGLRDDFRGRMETLAHRNADPVRPVVARPARAEAPEDEIAQSPTVDAQFSAPDAAGLTASDDVGAHATDEDVTAPAHAQPFWALAPTERAVVDEQGAPLFRIGPTAWALVLEDRGGAYVVRHDDGRIGYLHDIADITKG